MKKVILLLSAVALFVPCRSVWPCSPATFSVVWPSSGQKNIPLNARIKLLCMESVCPPKNLSLVDSKGKPVAVKITEENKPKTKFGQKYFILTPVKNLAPNSSYKAVLAYSGTERSSGFETGVNIDKKPPLLDNIQIKADIEWAADKKNVLVIRAGMCSSREYTVKEARKSGFDIEKDEYLPEHYNVTVTLDNIVEDTDYTILHVFEIADDGTKKDTGEFSAPVLRLMRIDAKDAGKSKKYEIQAEDALGNVQPKTIEFRINFDKSNSSLTS